MADYSTTVAGIPFLIAGGCWAQHRLHAGIRYVPVASKLMKLLSSIEEGLDEELAEFYSMADCSTTIPGIPILSAGGCWARRQLHASIRNVPIAGKLKELVTCLEVVPWRNSTRWLIAPQPLQVFQF